MYVSTKPLSTLEPFWGLPEALAGHVRSGWQLQGRRVQGAARLAVASAPAQMELGSDIWHSNVHVCLDILICNHVYIYEYTYVYIHIHVYRHHLMST